MNAFGHPYYYYENLDGGHSGDADLAQVAELDALQMVYFTRKLITADGAQDVFSALRREKRRIGVAK
jgi:hypothetical protein